MGSSRSRAEYAGLFFSEERSQRPGAHLPGTEARTVHTPEQTMRTRNHLAPGVAAAAHPLYGHARGDDYQRRRGDGLGHAISHNAVPPGRAAGAVSLEVDYTTSY